MARNKAVGTCPCPYTGCDEVTPVFRFQSKSADPARQRHAGKLYQVCPKHGMLRDQDWLLENATITGAEPEPASPPEPPAGHHDADDESPVADPVPAEDQPPASTDDNKDSWGFF